MSKKISISIVWLQKLYGDMRALEIAAAIGADAVDFDLSSKSKWNYQDPDSVYSRSDEEIEAYFTGLYEKAKSLGIEICQTHGRTCSYSRDPEENIAIREHIRRDCLATRALHAPYCIMHNVSSTRMGENPDPELMYKICFSVFNQMLTYAKQYGIKIVTETFGAYGPTFQHCDFFGNSYEFKKMYELICAEGNNAEYFRVCIDTGHSNMATRFGNLTVPDMIRLMGKHITCLHLHDNDGMTDQHKLPMTGTLDWDAVLDALDEVGYNGYYNLELRLRSFGEGFEIETAAFAVKHMRYMLDKRG